MVNIDKIRTLTKLKGLKLGFVQEQLGVRRTYFAEVKAGKDSMSEERIKKVAEILGTTYEYLTDQTDNPEPRTKKDPFTRDYYSIDAINPPQNYGEFDYERYNELRLARHLTPHYAEDRLHLPIGYFDNVRDGKIRPSREIINALAIILESTYDYLMGLTDDPEIPLDDKTGVRIKVFGDVAAGIPIQQIDNFDPEDSDSWEEIDRRTAKNGTYFALRIKGESMMPRICNGDTVIVRWQNTIESGEIAVVAVNGDSATCKKVVYDPSGGMFCIALNPTFPPMYFSAKEIAEKPVTILGKVVELRAKI